MTLDVLCAAFFVLVFAYSIFEVWDLPRLARIFPLWISLVALVLSLIQLGIAMRRPFDPERARGSAFSDSAADHGEPRQVYRRAGYYVAWLLGLYGAIWFTGFVIAMTLFVLIFLRWEAKKGWTGCVLASVFSALFLAGISWIMTLYWPEGQLGRLLELPWPLN